MGFFSRLFRAAPGSEAGAEAGAGEWSRLPEGEASALVLASEEAQQILARFDIDAAVDAHLRWLPWLAQALAGVRDERLRPQVVADDTCSELGQWLRGKGRVALGEFPAFGVLCQRHAYFHEQAAVLLTHAHAGEQAQAEQVYKRCQHASRQVVLLLRELQRGQR